MTQTRTGFTTYNFWLENYYKSLDREIPDAARRNKSGKLQFNAYIRSLKDKYGFTQQLIDGLILYCFTHNPMYCESVSCYGKLDTIVRSAPDYARWVRDNKELIEHNGLFDAIQKTAVERPDIQRYLDSEYLDEYKKLLQ